MFNVVYLLFVFIASYHQINARQVFLRQRSFNMKRLVEFPKSDDKVQQYWVTVDMSRFRDEFCRFWFIARKLRYAKIVAPANVL